MTVNLPWKHISIEVVLIVSLSVLSGFFINYLSPKGIALVGDWDTSKGVISARSKAEAPVMHELEITDVHEAKRIYDHKKAVFLDARSRDDFMEGHIKGAVSLPVNRFDEEIESLMNKYPLSTYFITYCSGRECNDSHELAQHLLAAGYENVSVFIDGYPGWRNEGFPNE